MNESTREKNSERKIFHYSEKVIDQNELEMFSIVENTDADSKNTVIKLYNHADVIFSFHCDNHTDRLDCLKYLFDHVVSRLKIKAWGKNLADNQ